VLVRDAIDGHRQPAAERLADRDRSGIRKRSFFHEVTAENDSNSKGAGSHGPINALGP
jgi:hypothetical protein